MFNAQPPWAGTRQPRAVAACCYCPRSWWVGAVDRDPKWVGANPGDLGERFQSPACVVQLEANRKRGGLAFPPGRRSPAERFAAYRLKRA